MNPLFVGRFSNNFELLARSKATTKTTSVAVVENVSGCETTLQTEFCKKTDIGSQCFAFFALSTLKLNKAGRGW